MSAIQKPLTDEELNSLRQSNGAELCFVTLRELRVIARAVEQAHGIGKLALTKKRERK